MSVRVGGVSVGRVTQDLIGALPHAHRLLADTPATWRNPPPMSTLHALLLFVGVPAGLFVVITLLVMAPSIVRGPRYRPGQQWFAEPEWFGAPADQVGGDGKPVAEIAASPGAQPVVRSGPDGAAEGVGGASARW
jgi:hypothetical protein